MTRGCPYHQDFWNGDAQNAGFPYHCDTGGRVERNIGNEVEWNKEKISVFGIAMFGLWELQNLPYELFSAGVFVRG